MLYDLKNIKKIYNDKTVLDLPKLSFEKGRIYGLMGPNGSGKTTLLNILSFLSFPSTGKLVFENERVSFSSKKALQALRKKVVLVDQHPILFSTSVYKNVEFGLKARKIPKAHREQIIEESLDWVGMRDFIQADARHLSGGETQRIAVARALACSPNIMLFDEPTASVDLSSQTAIERIIYELNRFKSLSIIFSTHDLSQASKLADEKIFLFEGQQSAFIYENIFMGKIVFKGNQKYCLIHENIWIPIYTGNQGDIIKISVNPEAVKIKNFSNTRNHQGNILKGKIIQLSQEKGNIRVLIDIGIPLSLRMVREEYIQLGICIDDEIMVECPRHGVKVI